AAQCLMHPGHLSVWSAELGRWVCINSPQGQEAIAQTVPAPKDVPVPTPISPAFKLVFWTSAVGTLFFVVLCVTVTFALGKDPPPMWERLATSIMDLAKIGFGAMVGLLGAKAIDGKG